MPSLRFTLGHHTFPALMMRRHYAILLAPYSRTWGGWNYETSWWLRRLVWTEWRNCPASPAAIVVIAQGLWRGNGFQGTSLLIAHCCVQNYDSLCDSTCRVSKNFISTLAAFSPKSHTHSSCWNTSYLSPIQYLNHGSTKQLQYHREPFSHVYTVHCWTHVFSVQDQH
jgi:hypothetical protein